MIRAAAAIVLLLGLSATSALAGGKVEPSLRAPSPVLGRDIAYSLYLPQNLSSPPAVLYLLHGLGGNERDWLHLGQIQKTADRLIDEARMPPMAIVMPNGGNSWYVDSDAHGPIASALLNDFMPHVERFHGLRSDRDGRFIAGLSMGGYGALRLAIMHPERFRGAASLSGAIFEDLQNSAQVSDDQIRMFKGAFGEPFATNRYNQLNFFSRLPVLQTTGRIPDLFISVGDDDGFGLYEGAVALYLRLKRLRLPVEMRIVDGNHNWRLWREDIIPVLSHFGTILHADAKTARRVGN